MPYRPYPNTDRALRQVARGAAPRPLTALEQRLAVQATTALEAGAAAMRPLMASLRRKRT